MKFITYCNSLYYNPLHYNPLDYNPLHYKPLDYNPLHYNPNGKRLAFVRFVVCIDKICSDCINLSKIYIINCQF